MAEIKAIGVGKKVVKVVLFGFCIIKEGKGKGKEKGKYLDLNFLEAKEVLPLKLIKLALNVGYSVLKAGLDNVLECIDPA